MSAFQYFLPNVTSENLVKGGKLDHQVLLDHGLAQILADVELVSPHVPAHASVCGVERGKGPGGTSGVVLSPKSKASGNAPKIGYFADRQTWIKIPALVTPHGDRKLAWLGWFNADPPANRDLERRQVVRGYPIADPHNYEWHIPVARSPQPGFAYGTLPQSFVFDAGGEPQGVLDPDYAWLWELAAQIRDWYRAGETPPEDASPEEVTRHEEALAEATGQREPFSWLVKQAVRILAVNYRVGTAELTALHTLGRGVLSQSTVHTICQAVFDWEIFEEAKKNLTVPAQEAETSVPAPPSSCSTTGGAAPPESPGTAPAGAG